MERKKLIELIKIVKEEEKNGKYSLIFTKTRAIAEEISALLNFEGIKSGYLHGGLKDRRTDIILDEMKKSGIHALAMTAKMGGEGLNMQDFKTIIHLTPHSEGFAKDQLRGRIRGGTEYYLLFKDTKEMKRFASRSDEEEDYAFTAVSSYNEGNKIKLLFKHLGNGAYSLSKDKKTEEDIEINVPYEIENMDQLKNLNKVGSFGQAITEEYIKNKGLKSQKVGEYLKQIISTESDNKTAFLLSLCDTCFDFFIPEKNMIFEVKTTFSTKTNLSKWQKELAKKGNLIGFEVIKISIFLGKMGFQIVEEDIN